ncbi:MAG TPA: hypothetical protein VJ901_09955 [Thermoanaerobaculia bacterium]|nr:hypothetical protein [Thermoanaerobaculia bacterium]
MTLPRLLLVLFLACSALAQNDVLIADHVSPIEAAAAGHSSMLAVFTTRGKLSPCTCGEIDAVRVGFDGNRIGAPFAIATSFSAQTQPAVAFDGTRFLVVWNELAVPPLFGEEPSRVIGAFVSEDGTPSTSFAIAAANVVRPVIVWDGTQYFIFYTDLDGHAMGVVVTNQGVARTPFVIGDEEQVTGAAVGGSQVAIVSSRGNRLQAQILGGAAQELASSDAYQGRIAWNGRTFLAAWLTSDAIYARRLDEREPHVVATASAGALQLISSGSIFFAAWEGNVMSGVWIGAEPFGVLPDLESRHYPLTLDPHDPVPVDVPGDTIALFHTTHFFLSQFTNFINDYVSFVKPGRQHATRR